MKCWRKNALLLTIGWLLLAAAAAQVVALRQTVNVSSDVVHLSDLLPSTASAELIQRAQAIELCRAPQYGSVRLFEHANLVEILDVHPDLAGRLLIPDRISIIRAGYPLSLAAIHDAITNFLREKGSIDLSGSTFSWPTDITTTKANPELEVRSVNQDPSTKRLQFHLRCKESHACPDFVVSSQPPLGAIAQTKSHDLVRVATKNASVAQGDAPILVQAGRRMALLMQGDGIQISAQVVCLQNGRMGETIRVRQIGSAHVFRAEVMSRDLLWSKLES